MAVDISETAARSRFGASIVATGYLWTHAWTAMPDDPDLLEPGATGVLSASLEGGGLTASAERYVVELRNAFVDCPARAACHREFIATFVIVNDHVPRTLRWYAGVEARTEGPVCEPVLTDDVAITLTLIDRVGGTPTMDAAMVAPPDAG